MSTNAEGAPRPEEPRNPDDFGQYIGAYFSSGIVERVFQPSISKTAESTLEFDIDEQRAILASLPKLTPLLASRLNTERERLSEIGTDANGPVGILANVAEDIRLDTRVFPLSNMLHIYHDTNGNIRVTHTPNEYENAAEVLLWTFSAHAPDVTTEQVQGVELRNDVAQASESSSKPAAGNRIAELFARLRRLRYLLGDFR